VKHLRGAGNAAGQLAQGLLNHAHRVSPKIIAVLLYLRNPCQEKLEIYQPPAF